MKLRYKIRAGKAFDFCHLQLIVILIIGSFCFLNKKSLGQSLLVNNMPVTDGEVRAIVNDGNTVYIGGSFSYVGPYTGGGVPVDTTTGSLVQGFPAVDGYLMTVEPDGSGGWYIGGDFDKVGDIAITNLAHINADLSVDQSWTPNPNNQVNAIAVTDSIIYVGGYFQQIGSAFRSYLAAVDPSTGLATNWSPNPYGSHINVIKILPNGTGGSTVYVGGNFYQIGGANRSCIAAIDASTGRATSWEANASNQVNTIVFSSSGSTVYAGGQFTSIGDSTRKGIAGIDASTGQVTDWNPAINGTVSTLDISGSKLYVGGSLRKTGEQTTHDLAAIDTSTGKVTAWAPDVSGLVNSLSIEGTMVFVGGDFTGIAGKTRYDLAAIDTSGNVTSWNPFSNTNGQVQTVATSGSTVYAGGDFTSIDGKMRNNIAAIDATTGNVTDWNPDTDGEVYTLQISPNGTGGSTIYAGGQFTSIGDSSRNYIAAIDASTGLATGWNPDANNYVNTMSLSTNGKGATMYAGGQFTSIGGSARNHLAAIDAKTGKATTWDPDANLEVYSLAISPISAGTSTIYAGGRFYNIGDSTRNYLAAIDATNGQATAWNPDISGVSVSALAISNSTLYIGGSFTKISDSTRFNIAAINRSTGKVTSWNPGVGGDLDAVETVVLSPNETGSSAVYAGGAFESAGQQTRNYIAAIDPTTGNVTSWNPDANLTVFAISMDYTNKRIYVGGKFTKINGSSHAYFAGLTNPDDQALPVEKFASSEPSKFVLQQNYPNPFNPSTTIRFKISSPGLVSLKIYDVLGREVATLVNRQMSPGSYDVKWNAAGFASGVYFYRIRAGNIVQVRKMLYLK